MKTRKLSYVTPTTQILENADRQQHIICMKVETFKIGQVARYWAALLLALHFYPSKTKFSWLRPQVHPRHTPAWRNNRHCDERWSSLWVVPLVSEKKNKQTKTSNMRCNISKTRPSCFIGVSKHSKTDESTHEAVEEHNAEYRLFFWYIFTVISII